MTAERLNEITEIIIGAAISVHRALGPGLLESVYLACLIYELIATDLKIETQRALPVVYRGVRLECGFRADLIVEGCVIVEVKSIERLAPVHQAQMITYLRLSGCSLGLILNFNTKLMKDGIKRAVNAFPTASQPIWKFAPRSPQSLRFQPPPRSPLPPRADQNAARPAADLKIALRSPSPSAS
jgi:GxxExxY protein